MRVIAGEARGRTLKSGKGTKARPTTDMVKEALFNYLGNFVIDANFLDLYAGFGGIGIEAISRGCTKAVFVEEDVKHVAIIKENVSTLKFEDRAEIYRGDVLKVLPTLKDKFDIIFVDPPYDSGLYEETLELIYAKALLQPNGLIICEHNTGLPPKVSDVFEIIKQKTYGETGLTTLVLKR